MADEQKDFTEQIDAYLRKTLSEEEARLFETELDKSPRLQSELKLHLQALVAIRQKGFQEEITNQSLDETPIKKVNWTRMAVAASAVLLVGAMGAWWWTQKSTIDSEELFATYYYAPEVQTDLRGTSSSETPLEVLQPLYENFSKGDYDASIASFHQIAKDSLEKETTSALMILMGISQFESGSIDSANYYLNQASLNSDQKEWYQAMILLKQNKLPETAEQLRAIVRDENHTYYLQAIELLEKLK